MESITNIISEDWLEIIVRCGLGFAAVLQIILILACLLLPNIDPTGNGSNYYDSNECSPEHSSAQNTPKRPHYRIRKQDKKKRR